MLHLEKSKLAKKQDVEDRKNQWIEAQKSLNDAKIALNRPVSLLHLTALLADSKSERALKFKWENPSLSFYDPSELIVEFDIPTNVLKLIEKNSSHFRNNEQKVIIDGKKMIVPQIQRMIDPDTHMSPAYVNYSCENCVIGSNITVDFVATNITKFSSFPSMRCFCVKAKLMCMW